MTSGPSNFVVRTTNPCVPRACLLGRNLGIRNVLKAFRLGRPLARPPPNHMLSVGGLPCVC
jgi:hypothetical protein